MALRQAIAMALLAGLLAACGGGPQRDDYVARVGTEYLTAEEVSQALSSLPPMQDSVEARRQIVEQWVTNELLFQEARRRGLLGEPEVQHQLEQNERSVLVSALLSRLYEDQTAAPQQAELSAYFEQNKNQFRLREPYVRVRYLAHANPDSAALARRLLQDAVIAGAAEALWPRLVRRFAADPEGALSLASNLYPESQLFMTRPALRAALEGLETNRIAPLIEADGAYHLLQVAERASAGSLPQIAWVRAELERRLTIQARKQIYARQVQRLRSEALAREDLEMQ